MATLNILTPEELASRDQKSRSKGVGRGRRRSAERTRIIDGFKEVLQQAKPGYGADVLLGEDEHKRTVSQNLKAAADELGMALEFRPIKVKNRIHFRVITLEEKAALPKRPGRPRKVQPEAHQETSNEPQQGTSGNGTEPPAAAPARLRRRRKQPQEATPGE